MTNSAIPCDPNQVEEPERCLLGKINIAGAYELLTGEPLKEVEKQGKEGTAEKEAGEQLPVTLVSPQSPVITAISNLNNLENGTIPSNITEN